MELKGVAYPKINLCLYIGSKRPDGYHNLISIFQLVRDEKLFDDISISVIPDKKSAVTVCGLDDVADKNDNTVLRAASLYLADSDVTDSLSITVKKNIPSLAGLGGGSSDAGCILNLLNLFYRRFDNLQLMNLALKIGSDVPFFLCGSDTAVVEGRGEIISPMQSRTDLSFSLIKGDERKIGTGYAYGELDRRKSVPNLPDKEELVRMYNNPVSEWNFTNDFEILYSPKPGMHLTGSGSWFYKVSECN